MNITYHTWESIGDPFGDFAAGRIRPYNDWAPGMNIMIRIRTLSSTKRNSVPQTANYYLTVVNNSTKGRELRLCMLHTWFQYNGPLNKRETFQRYRESFRITSSFKRYDWLGVELERFYRNNFVEFQRRWYRNPFILDRKNVPLWYKWIPQKGKLIFKKQSKMISPGVHKNIAQIKGSNIFVTFPFGPGGPWAEWDMVNDREVLHPYLQDGHLDTAKGIGILVDENFRTEGTTPLWYLLNHQKNLATLTTRQSENSVEFVMREITLRQLRTNFKSGQNYSIPLSFKYKHNISFEDGPLPSVFNWTLTSFTEDTDTKAVKQYSMDSSSTSSASSTSSDESMHSSDDDDDESIHSSDDDDDESIHSSDDDDWFYEGQADPHMPERYRRLLRLGEGSAAHAEHKPHFRQYHLAPKNLPPRKRYNKESRGPRTQVIKRIDAKGRLYL